MGVCEKQDAPEFVTPDGHMSRCWLLDERGRNYRPAGFGGAEETEGRQADA